MVGCRGGHHDELSGLLDQVGWSISRLAHEVNREVGAGYVSRTTASEWVNMSRVPRPPLPTVIAYVLSQAAGRVVAVKQLWPRAASSSDWLPADAGTQVSWDLQGTKALINSWLPSGGTVFEGDRRSFMALSGVALTAPAWQYVNHVKDVPARGMFEQVLGASDFSSPKVSSASLEYFHSLIGAFRRMDDIAGGSAENLRQIGGAIETVMQYLDAGSFTDPGIARTLLEVLAKLSQIAGWMAFDAERHGLAQLYFRTGLQAAHNVGDHGLGAHILSFMSYQATHRQQLTEARDLADASVRAAAKAHPLVQTVAMTRVAHAHAAVGDLYGFQTASAQVRRLFEQAQRAGGGPEYLYWLDPTAADTYQGHSMLLMTLARPQQAKARLAEAERLLASEVHQQGPDRPRDAVFFGAWLARVHVRRGDLHQGLNLAQAAIDRVPAVASPRSRQVLFDLDKDLANLRSDRNLPEVRELRKQLRPALAA